MSTRGITLVRGTIVVLDLDGTLVYVEDVQPTGARVVALPEQPADRKENAVFTPGRVGSKVISPYSGAARTLEVKDLTERNKEFIGTFEKLRTQHGPNYVARTPEEEAAMSVTKAKQADAGKVHRAPRGAKKSPEERKNRRAAKRAAKVPCEKCGLLPIHASHQRGGDCEYQAPVKKGRARSASADEPDEPKTGKTYRVKNTDIAALQAENDKFAQGNRFYRVFLALKNLPESTGTLAQVIGAVAQDAGKPMTNPEKVARRALKALCDSQNVETI
jgi:hypothetical protein